MHRIGSGYDFFFSQTCSFALIGLGLHANITIELITPAEEVSSCMETGKIKHNINFKNNMVFMLNIRANLVVTNSVQSVQTVPKEQRSDLGLH